MSRLLLSNNTRIFSRSSLLAPSSPLFSRTFPCFEFQKSYFSQRVPSVHWIKPQPFIFTQVRHFSGPVGPLPREQVVQRVLAVMKACPRVAQSKVTTDAHFNKDLGLDSLDAVEVVMMLEDEFSIEIPDDEADKIQTIADAIDYIAAVPSAK
eukprot:TRINITY_DN335_c0_g1_i1.p1 TRINITY_DN335_c0_g1~~TRINITY_DN335_c0_g1_i1.p1  ORF type:complete len:172 (-),score=62.49 TRINITY_DN335_c0_g1_i1:122-577(-)